MLSNSSLQKWRFTHEYQLFEKLERHPLIQNIQQKNQAKGENTFRYRQKHLLGNAMRLSEYLVPELYNIYQNALQKVGEGLTGSLYSYQSSEYNAHVYAQNQRYDIMLTSALIKDFRPNEIAFVIGHELGHVLFQHHTIPASNLLFDEEHQEDISLLLARDLLLWSQAAEISADRIGFFVCGQLDSAATAFFKTCSGLLIDDSRSVIIALRELYQELKRVTRFTNLSSGFNTHPLIPVRFRSLELLAEINSYDENAREALDERTRATLERIDSVNLAGTKQLNNTNFLHLKVLCLIYLGIMIGSFSERKENFIRQSFRNTQIDQDDLEAELQRARTGGENLPAILLKELVEVPVNQDELVGILRTGIEMYQNLITYRLREAMEELCKTFRHNPQLIDQFFANSLS